MAFVVFSASFGLRPGLIWLVSSGVFRSLGPQIGRFPVVFPACLASDWARNVRFSVVFPTLPAPSFGIRLGPNCPMSSGISCILGLWLGPNRRFLVMFPHSWPHFLASDRGPNWSLSGRLSRRSGIRLGPLRVAWFGLRLGPNGLFLVVFRIV